MKDERLEISELFFSIQGESLYSGYPCVFIRLAGCNLRCSYCDAQYTYNEPGQSLSIKSILAFTQNYPNSLIEVTGGEPLIQKNTILLLESLLHAKRTILLETNGSINLSAVPKEIIKIVDLKCPSSGMHDQMQLDNFGQLRGQDEIKCVISTRDDYDWAKEFLSSKDLFHPPLSGPNPTITFSPVTKVLEAGKLAEWMLADNLPARMQIQLHKILWPDIERGA